MQESKYKEAIRYYEPAVKKMQVESILKVPAIVLANLCVAYIMTSQNEEAEELMRRVEKEEECEADPDKQAAPAPCRHPPSRPTPPPGAPSAPPHRHSHLSPPCARRSPDEQMFHLCIINLVIGTLYALGRVSDIAPHTRTAPQLTSAPSLYSGTARRATSSSASAA